MTGGGRISAVLINVVDVGLCSLYLVNHIVGKREERGERRIEKGKIERRQGAKKKNEKDIELPLSVQKVNRRKSSRSL
jgi:hypothetical protein